MIRTSTHQRVRRPVPPETATPTRRDPALAGRRLWVATDVETGVTTRGESKVAALENLDDAVAVYTGERGNPPTGEERREIRVDPVDNTTGDREPPDVRD